MKNKVIYIVCIVIILLIISFLGEDIINNFNLDEDYLDNVKFSKCVDGDTAYFIVNGKREKVRFLGVDTPEYDDEYGDVASEYTCNKLKNAKRIRLEYDSNSKKYDKYNRLLVWVFIDDNNYNLELVERGYARVRYIYGNYKYVDKLCELEYNANKNSIGIWKLGKYNYSLGYCSKRG